MPVNTSSRPSSVKLSPSTVASQPPCSGSTTSSFGPVSSACEPCTTVSPQYVQPADSGVISSIHGLLDQRFDLRLVGHRVRARKPRRDERAGGVAEAKQSRQLPARQQSVAQRPAECVARAEAV